MNCADRRSRETNNVPREPGKETRDCNHVAKIVTLITFATVLQDTDLPQCGFFQQKSQLLLPKSDLAIYLADLFKKTHMKRKATAVWNGNGKEGKGHVSTQSTVLNKTQYSYKSRFEEGVGTNPEELGAAAHAACSAMNLSFILH